MVWRKSPENLVTYRKEYAAWAEFLNNAPTGVGFSAFLGAVAAPEHGTVVALLAMAVIVLWSRLSGKFPTSITSLRKVKRLDALAKIQHDDLMRRGFNARAMVQNFGPIFAALVCLMLVCAFLLPNQSF